MLAPILAIATEACWNALASILQYGVRALGTETQIHVRLIKRMESREVIHTEIEDEPVPFELA
jgi:hypothetical protein